MSKLNTKKPVVRDEPKVGIVTIYAKPAKHEHRVVTTTASSENRSAKFKGGKQDVHPAGRNQYQA